MGRACRCSAGPRQPLGDELLASHRPGATGIDLQSACGWRSLGPRAHGNDGGRDRSAARREKENTSDGASTAQHTLALAPSASVCAFLHPTPAASQITAPSALSILGFPRICAPRPISVRAFAAPLSASARVSLPFVPAWAHRRRRDKKGKRRGKKRKEKTQKKEKKEIKTRKENERRKENKKMRGGKRNWKKEKRKKKK